MDHLRSGDSLVVWRLDRLGRSLPHLLETVAELEKRGVELKSLQEAIDTNKSGGRLIFHIFGAVADFERPADQGTYLYAASGYEARWVEDCLLMCLTAIPH